MKKGVFIAVLTAVNAYEWGEEDKKNSASGSIAYSKANPSFGRSVDASGKK